MNMKKGNTRAMTMLLVDGIKIPQMAIRLSVHKHYNIHGYFLAFRDVSTRVQRNYLRDRVMAQLLALVE